MAIGPLQGCESPGPGCSGPSCLGSMPTIRQRLPPPVWSISEVRQIFAPVAPWCNVGDGHDSHFRLRPAPMQRIAAVRARPLLRRSSRLSGAISTRHILDGRFIVGPGQLPLLAAHGKKRTATRIGRLWRPVSGAGGFNSPQQSLTNCGRRSAAAESGQPDSLQGIAGIAGIAPDFVAGRDGILGVVQVG